MIALGDIPSGLTRLLELIDQWAGERGEVVELHVLGSSALALAYVGGIQTKDLDVMNDNNSPLLQELIEFAGEGTDVHDQTNYYVEAVPPIYLTASGVRGRAEEVSGLPYTNLRIYVLELHDLVISKLKRFHAGDQENIEQLCRLPEFDSETLILRYQDARQEFHFERDILEKLDARFNLVLEQFAGAQPVNW